LLFTVYSCLWQDSAHNPKVRGSNPLPATNKIKGLADDASPFLLTCSQRVDKEITREEMFWEIIMQDSDGRSQTA